MSVLSKQEKMVLMLKYQFLRNVRVVTSWFTDIFYSASSNLYYYVAYFYYNNTCKCYQNKKNTF